MTTGNLNEKVYLTREKLREFEEELRLLKTEGRRDIAAKIAEARAHGDLSENAEYDAAKEAQQHLEYKISKLEKTLSRARVIDSKSLPNDKIYILSKAKIRDSKTKKELIYTLVSPEEANFEQNKISVTSPIGKSLLGKKVGEKIEVKVPAGVLNYEVLEISK